jgi:GTP-binding protein EngB required for normal cell division
MINRSINYVSILFVGPSGVGKSATVNHFLGISDVAKTNEDQSETRSTKEFVVHGSDPEYEVNELPLGLVDTPGFCDTDGTVQDAYNFLSVETFFRTHPMLSKCYPNLILLVVNATDNRMMGKNSDLGKSLRCLKQLNLVDPKNPNVVTVVTHVCSIRKKTGKEWIKALDKIKSKVSKIVFDDLRVYAPVVLIENEYDDCALKHRGDFTCLPNGEFQPKNLYLACADVLGNDSLGLITLNSIFKESKKRRDHIRISEGHEVKATIARTGLGAEEKSLVTRFEIAARGTSFWYSLLFFPFIILHV